MSKNLVIVESPAKAKTIEKFLGKDYTVRSSFGHIRDIPKKGMNIDIENGFTPTYEISPDKKKTIAELRKLAKTADVWLASDEDREGEAIAWHLAQALKLDPKSTKRIVFHEITKTAIEAAIKNPRTVDLNLVDAQQARRVLDRLVGYELSPVLWKKVRTGLSAGRVQSVAVRLIVEREREIRDFESQSTYKITAEFNLTNNGAEDEILKAELANKLPDQAAAEKFLKDCIGAGYKVAAITRKPGSRSPSAPFTTSSLQQEAARRLGYGVRQTMTLAQRLYEAGHITYMRTDSTILSGLAIKAAEDYIKTSFGDNYHQVRQYKTKNASAQEAHEAIRPTNFKAKDLGEDASQKKLYNLIWQRALASQMTPAEIERTELSVGISSRKESLVAKGEILTFDGFLKVYGGGKDDTLLPPLNEGDSLTLEVMRATETFSRPPARYSEAALVKKLEELGIGRPSTYAPTISTVQTRGYVEKTDLEGVERKITELLLVSETADLKKLNKTKKAAEAAARAKSSENELPKSTAETMAEADAKTAAKQSEPKESQPLIEGVNTAVIKQITGADRAKLVPTGIAEVTTDFLVKHFPSIVDYAFTATVEEDFDKIADGKEEWTKAISAFYKDFHPLVEASADISRQEVSQAREIGKDPKSGKPIFARFGRYGPMLQRGATEDEENKPDFAPLPAETTIDTVTLEQALEMFKLPRLVGQTEADKDGNTKDIKANIGRFGPYIQVDKVYVSIKPLDPKTITLEEARQLYIEKLKKDADKFINEFKSGIKVVNGPYGPYITDGKKNAKIPKETDPKGITEEQAKKMLDEAPAKKKFARRRAPAKS
jgi:DNA topoisomerase-1